MMAEPAMAENHHTARFGPIILVCVKEIIGQLSGTGGFSFNRVFPIPFQARLKPRVPTLAFAIMTSMVSTLSAQVPQSAEPVRYTVSFPAPQTNYAEVAADFPTGGQPSIEIFMPVWTPGSYLVREYARNVEDVKGPGAVVKTTKNRWRIDTGGAAVVHVTYRIYCHEMSV